MCHPALSKPIISTSSPIISLVWPIKNTHLIITSSTDKGTSLCKGIEIFKISKKGGDHKFSRKRGRMTRMGDEEIRKSFNVAKFHHLVIWGAFLVKNSHLRPSKSSLKDHFLEDLKKILIRRLLGTIVKMSQNRLFCFIFKTLHQILMKLNNGIWFGIVLMA